MADLVESPAFEVDSYLEQRGQQTPFVTVEIGHGRYPLVANQPQFFTGERAYIGIEAGMRSGKDKAEELQAKLRTEYADVNAMFLFNDIGGRQNPLAAASNEGYEGGFEAETILSAGSGDELVASNVFGDPLIARHFGRTSQLLGEMSRLAGDGTIILRETVTPTEVAYVDYVAHHLGLQTLKRVTPADTVDWEQLELFYGTHKEWAQSVYPYNESYYLFLAKAAHTSS